MFLQQLTFSRVYKFCAGKQRLNGMPKTDSPRFENSRFRRRSLPPPPLSRGEERRETSSDAELPRKSLQRESLFPFSAPFHFVVRNGVRRTDIGQIAPIVAKLVRTYGYFRSSASLSSMRFRDDPESSFFPPCDGEILITDIGPIRDIGHHHFEHDEVRTHAAS